MTLLAVNLRKRAENLGLSNAEVARRSGVSERTYGNYVLGRTEPNLDTLLSISRVLATTVDLLLQSEDTPSLSDAMTDRLNIAVSSMSQTDVELLVVQAEAILALRKRQKR